MLEKINKLEKELLDLKKEYTDSQQKVQVGKFYKDVTNVFICYVTELGEDYIYGYGIDFKGNYFNNSKDKFTGCFNTNNKNIIEATASEFETSLRKYAPKIGLHEDAKIKEHACKNKLKYFYELNSGEFFTSFVNSHIIGLYNTNGLIFNNGDWAEPLVEEKTIEELGEEFREYFMNGKGKMGVCFKNFIKENKAIIHKLTK